MNDKLKHTIINYLNKEYSGLFRYEIERLPNYIFFMKDGKVIYEYNIKNGEVYISYGKIWSFLESFFGLEHEEIQSLTKEWVEEQFKSDVTTTCSTNQRNLLWVEEQFKSNVTITLTSQKPQSILVEEQYKLDTNER